MGEQHSCVEMSGPPAKQHPSVDTGVTPVENPTASTTAMGSSAAHKIEGVTPVENPPASTTATVVSSAHKIERVQASCTLVAAEANVTPQEVWQTIVDAESLYDYVNDDEFGDLTMHVQAHYNRYCVICNHLTTLCSEYGLDWGTVSKSRAWYEIYAYAEAKNQNLLETMRGELDNWYQHEYVPGKKKKKKKATSHPTAAYKPNEMTEIEQERMNKMKALPDGSLRKANWKKREKGRREKAQDKARDKN